MAITKVLWESLYWRTHSSWREKLVQQMEWLRNESAHPKATRRAGNDNYALFLGSRHGEFKLHSSKLKD